MSYYLCGEFDFQRKLSWGEQEDLAITLTELALSQRVFIQLAFSIAQPEVLEILHRSSVRMLDMDMAFFLADSPISLVSNGIVHPLGVAPQDMDKAIREGMRKVERFLNAVAKLQGLAGLTLYVSEGYDTEYEKEEISIEFLANRIGDLYRELGQIPSTKFLIRF